MLDQKTSPAIPAQKTSSAIPAQKTSSAAKLFPGSKNQTYLNGLLKKNWQANDISNRLILDVLGGLKWYMIHTAV